MGKQFLTKFLLVLALSVSLLMGLAVSVEAQGPTLTPTPAFAPTLTSTPTPGVQTLSNPNAVTFDQLRRGGEMEFDGPYDSNSFSFAIPANWVLTSGAALNLSMGVSFNTAVQSQLGTTVVGGGSFTVLLNNTVLAALPLDKVGEVETRISIPSDALVSIRNDGRMVLRFVLEAGASCRVVGDHTVVFVHPSSYLIFPHNVVKPPTNLVNFPEPIIQNSFMPDSALIIVPDQPSASELQAALTVAAGLGNLSGNTITLDMTTLGKFASDQVAFSDVTKNHLIFVGKAASLPVLSQFNLPLPVASGQFENPNGAPADGVVQMVDSPWSDAHVVLVVSGDTDEGVVKAAQAISDGDLRPNRVDNLAVVEQVSPVPTASPQAVDQTLVDLGSQGTLFSSRGVDSDTYSFNIPVGMTVTSDAYFELVFGHSALLDYNRSQIVVLLNSQPIGSVRMSDVTASLPTNKVKVMIPSAAVVPGKNYLEVRATMVPVDDCTPFGIQDLWVNVWPQSTLHLPLTPASVSPVASLDLADYPKPFTYDSVLGSTAFVLEKNDLQSWRNAALIASSLGYDAGGSFIRLSAFYGDDVPAAERSKYNFLVVGRPSHMSIMSDMNNALPAPFSIGSDVANEKDFQVQYRIPADSPMGYVEELPSPWNPDNVALTILGNTTQGVDWAAASVIDPTLRSRLAGNFAAVNDRQIITTDTRLASVSTGGNAAVATQASGAAASPSGGGAGPAPSPRPGWVLPVLILALALIFLILGVIFARGRSRTKVRGHQKEENNN